MSKKNIFTIIKKFFSVKSNRLIISFFKKKFLTPVSVSCLVSILLLIFMSPILSLLWLCICTLYFLYIYNYKNIYKIWVITIGVWYLIFSTSLSEITILIGGENTKLVINYLLLHNVIFENLCFQTVYILDILSSKFGFSIYIPSLVNFFFSLFKFFGFGNGKTGCSTERKKSQSEKDMEKCPDLARQVNDARKWNEGLGRFHRKAKKTDGDRTIHYSETWIPFVGTFPHCTSTEASEEEKAFAKTNKLKK